MARLRFGTDSLGKEILELLPAPPPLPPLSSSSSPASPPPATGDGVSVAMSSGDNTWSSEQAKEGGLSNASLPYKGENTIVMMEWERPYMRALVDALGITEESNVLEIGFGCGYSADRFQELSPRSHTIVEPDRVVLERLRGWAETRKGVRVVEGFWQTALPSLGTYDAIFFDDFPLPGTPESADLRGPVSRWHAFIDLCVGHHLPVGGRITGYLARPLPLDRPGCEAAPLVPFPVQVPENCPYFPYGEAYIPLITRTDKKGNEGLGGAARGAAPPREDSSATTTAPARKRQKRLVLEALVRDSLGLGV